MASSRQTVLRSRGYDPVPGLPERCHDTLSRYVIQFYLCRSVRSKKQTDLIQKDQTRFRRIRQQSVYIRHAVRRGIYPASLHRLDA